MSQPRWVRPATAVIVTYQSSRTIGRALEAARRCYDALLLDTVVVDNDSTDTTCEIVNREAAWVRLISSKKNNGFGRGCNIGSEGVATPYTIFINPDAEVEPEAIKTMLEFMEQHPAVGIVGPAIVEGNRDGTKVLQETGIRPTPWTMLRREAPFFNKQSIAWPIVPGSEPSRTGWVCGAVFMIRTDLFKQLNGFDPRFFLYWEETDLCKRAEDMGFATWALGTALAHHIGGESSTADDTRIDGCIAKHYLQSRHYYMRKHHGALAATIAEVGEFLLLGIRSLTDLARGRPTNRLRSRFQAPLLSQPEK